MGEQKCTNKSKSYNNSEDNNQHDNQQQFNSHSTIESEIVPNSFHNQQSNNCYSTDSHHHSNNKNELLFSQQATAYQDNQNNHQSNYIYYNNHQQQHRAPITACECCSSPSSSTQADSSINNNNNCCSKQQTELYTAEHYGQLNDPIHKWPTNHYSSSSYGIQTTNYNNYNVDFNQDFYNINSCSRTMNNKNYSTSIGAGSGSIEFSGKQEQLEKGESFNDTGRIVSSWDSGHKQLEELSGIAQPIVVLSSSSSTSTSSSHLTTLSANLTTTTSSAKAAAKTLSTMRRMPENSDFRLMAPTNIQATSPTSSSSSFSDSNLSSTSTTLSANVFEAQRKTLNSVSTCSKLPLSSNNGLITNSSSMRKEQTVAVEKESIGQNPRIAQLNNQTECRQYAYNNSLDGSEQQISGNSKNQQLINTSLVYNSANNLTEQIGPQNNNNNDNNNNDIVVNHHHEQQQQQLEGNRFSFGPDSIQQSHLNANNLLIHSTTAFGGGTNSNNGNFMLNPITTSSSSSNLLTFDNNNNPIEGLNNDTLSSHQLTLAQQQSFANSNGKSLMLETGADNNQAASYSYSNKNTDNIEGGSFNKVDQVGVFGASYDKQNNNNINYSQAFNSVGGDVLYQKHHSSSSPPADLGSKRSLLNSSSKFSSSCSPINNTTTTTATTTIDSCPMETAALSYSYANSSLNHQQENNDNNGNKWKQNASPTIMTASTQASSSSYLQAETETRTQTQAQQYNNQSSRVEFQQEFIGNRCQQPIITDSYNGATNYDSMKSYYEQHFGYSNNNNHSSSFVNHNNLPLCSNETSCTYNNNNNNNNNNDSNNNELILHNLERSSFITSVDNNNYNKAQQQGFVSGGQQAASSFAPFQQTAYYNTHNSNDQHQNQNQHQHRIDQQLNSQQFSLTY